jgi:hypothetical protein
MSAWLPKAVFRNGLGVNRVWRGFGLSISGNPLASHRPEIWVISPADS